MKAASAPLKRVLRGTSTAPAECSPTRATSHSQTFGVQMATRSPGSTPAARKPRAARRPASAKSAKLMRTSPSTTASRSPKRSAALCTSRGVVPHSRSPRMAATVAERPDGPSGSVRGMGEVEEAFRHYWRVGAVGEDWEAWADLFTDDAVYREHILGHMRG